MSQIGTLTGGAGVVTTINLQYVPEYIVVGTAFANTVLSGISWNISGQEQVNVSGAVSVNALAKFKNRGTLTNQTVDTIFSTGFGYLQNKQFQLRLTNAGATTPAVLAFSRKFGNGRVLTAAQQVVVDGANQRFRNFLGLQFLPTNVSRVDLTFRNPKTGETYSDSFLPAEVNALFGLDNISEDGVLSTLSVLDNSNILAKMGVFIEEATVYASGANVTVTFIGLSKVQ